MCKKGECRIFCVVYKVTCKYCGNFHIGNTQKHTDKKDIHFQNLSQKVIQDKNSDSFDVYFAKYFTQKPIPQKCHKIASFKKNPR